MQYRGLEREQQGQDLSCPLHCDRSPTTDCGGRGEKAGKNTADGGAKRIDQKEQKLDKTDQKMQAQGIPGNSPDFEVLAGINKKAALRALSADGFRIIMNKDGEGMTVFKNGQVVATYDKGMDCWNANEEVRGRIR
jgi:hypothetical protein